MKLIAVTPCQDPEKLNDNGTPVIYDVGTEFDASDKAGKDFLEIGAAVKPDDKKAQGLIANAKAMANINASALNAIDNINQNTNVTTPGSIA